MNIRTFLSIVEIRTKTVSVSTLLLAHLCLWFLGCRFQVDLTVVLVVSVLVMDMGTTAFNTFFDYMRGVDKKETNLEKDKVIVHEQVAPGSALLIALGCFSLSAILGLYLMWKTGFFLLVLGLLSFLVGYFYSGGKRPISSTPLGEVFAGGGLGCLLWMVIAFVQGGSLRDQNGFWLTQFFFSLPSMLLIASILGVNNASDRLADGPAGRKTLAVLFPTLGVILTWALPVIGWGLMIFWTLVLKSPWWVCLFPVLTFLLAIPIYITMYKRGFHLGAKGPNMGAINRIFALFTLGQGLFWIFSSRF